MSEKNDKSYIDEFIEAQENQYVQWKYPASGRPTPFDEARGNAKLLGIFYCGVSLLNAFVGILAFRLIKDIKILFVFFGVALLGIAVGIGYFRKDKERKAYARKQAEIEKNKHKRKYRDKNK